MLEKTGVWSHSDRVRLLDFFSTTLEEYRKGKSGPEGLCSKEGTNFLVLGVCGCPRSQDISSVVVLISSMSSLDYHSASPNSLMA